MNNVMIKDHLLSRDINSMGISNENDIEREAYYNKVKLGKLQNDKYKQLDTKIEDLSLEMQEIKSLLLKLLEK